MTEKKVCKTFFYSLLFVAVMLMSLVPFTEATDLKVCVKLKELDTSESIDAKVSIEVLGTYEEFDRKGPGEYGFKGTLRLEGLEAYRFDLAPSYPYFSRTVPIRCNRFKEETELVYSGLRGVA